MEGVSPLGGLVQISTDLYKRSALLQIRFREDGVLRDYSLAKHGKQAQAAQTQTQRVHHLDFSQYWKALPTTDTVGIHIS